MPSSIQNQRYAIEVKTSKGYKIIDSEKTVYLEAKGKFTILHLEDHSQIITYHLLKWYTKYLFEPYYFRCHNSFIVNCSYVDCYSNKEIIMLEGSRLPLSRSKILKFKENLKYLVLL